MNRFSGNNFAPNQDVRITTNFNGREVQINQARTDIRGSFNIPNLYSLDNMDIFNSFGTYVIRATDESGQSSQDTFVYNYPILHVFGDEAYARRDFSLWVGPGSDVVVHGRGYRPNQNLDLLIFHENDQDADTIRRRVHVDGMGNIDRSFSLDPNDFIEGGYIISTDTTDQRQTSQFRFLFDRGPAASDLDIVGIEVTQGLQDLDNSVTLIRKKRTWVRVYVEAENSPVLGVTCLLTAEKNGQQLTAFTGDPNNPRTSILRAFCNYDENGNPLPCGRNQNYYTDVQTGPVDRGNLESSFNFYIPYDWIEEPGDISFTARTYSESVQSDYTNDDTTITVSFEDTNPLVFTRLRIHTHKPGNPHLNHPDYGHISNYVRNMYPLSHNDLLEYSDSEIIEPYLHAWHLGDEYNLEDRGENDFGDIVANLNVHSMFNSTPGPILVKHIWYGMISPATAKWFRNGTSYGPDQRAKPFSLADFNTACGQYFAYSPFIIGSVTVPRNNTIHIRRITDYWKHPYGGRVTAHEFGHLFNLCHIECSGKEGGDCRDHSPTGHFIGDTSDVQNTTWGFGTHRTIPVAIPPNTNELMTYCSDRWINRDHYEEIHEHLNPCGPGVPLVFKYFCHNNSNELFDTYNEAQRSCRGNNNFGGNGHTIQMGVFCGEKPLESSVQTNALTREEHMYGKYPYKILIGEFDEKENKLKLLPLLPAGGDQLKIAQAFQLQEKNKGDLDIVMTDKNGSSVYKSSIQLMEESENTKYDKPEHFFMYLPADMDDGNLLFYSGGKKIESIKPSKNAPVIGSLNGPKYREILEKSCQLSWTVSDKDKDELSGIVQYSPDGGKSWKLIRRIEPDKSSMTIELSEFEGSYIGLFRIIVTDGFHYDVKITPHFIIPNRRPTVEILTHEMPAKIGQWDVFTLKARAFDVEDGFLPDSQITWRSDVSGELGKGGEIDTYLPVGRHVITVSVVDKELIESTAELVLEIDK